MISREWILQTLAGLQLWYWPIFFWELAGLKAWWATNPVPPGTRVTFAVTIHGRIFVSGYYPPARPDPMDWTRYAPRAPWTRLDPDAQDAAFQAHLDETACDFPLCIPTQPSQRRGDTSATPAFLDSS